MPPKLPVKRPSESEHDRAPKKGGKAEPTYDTYDEALDGAVAMEEKGERYRNGEKAQRFYEQAAELYARAMGFDEKSFSAAYNLGRVWFILASQFYLPPNNLDVYSSSIQMYQKALQNTEDDNCKYEAAFNLAQTMNATADAVEEYRGGDETGREQGKELRSGAAWLLNTVIQGQMTYLRSEEAKEETEKNAATEDKGMEVEGKAEGDKPAEDGMEVDKPEGDAPKEKAAYTSNPPTRDAFVDTLLLQVEIGIALWNYEDPSKPPSDGQQEAIRGLTAVATMFGGPDRQAEIDLVECKVLLAVDGAMYDIVRDQIEPGSGMEKNAAMAVKAVEAVLKSLDDQPASDDRHVRADLLETLAEAEMTQVIRLQHFLQKGVGNAEMATTAWAQLSAAATHLSTAAKLPVTATTPQEFKPNLYLLLLRNTLARARLAPYSEPAMSNITKLLDNCAAYAAKASEALGWKFAKLPREDDPQPNPFFVDPLEVPPPAGWDMEMLARDTQLEILRVCYFATTGIFGPKIDKDFYTAAATAILDGITSVSAGPRRLMPVDVGRFVSDLVDLEGPLSEGEDAWWKDVAERVTRHLPREGDAGLPLM